MTDDTQRMNSSEKPQLITIDLDGTLVDSVADLHAAVSLMQGTLSRPASSEEAVRRWVGNGIERLVHRALTDSMQGEASAPLFNTALAQFHIAYEQTNGTASTLYPGVDEGLKWLYALDVPLVCVTNKAGHYSRPLLEKLKIADYFQMHIAGDEMAYKKPDPSALLTASAHFNAQPSRSVMIGDSISDIKAARAAGFIMLSVSYGYNHGMSVRDLKASHAADAIVDTMAEIPDVLPALMRQRLTP